MLEEQLKLFDLPKTTDLENSFKRLRHPIWTENKAKLIERYLYYFVLITKHGTYIDGFAGPQEPEKPEMWAAKLALESEPRWMRKFYLFDSNRNQYERLIRLKEALPPRKKGEPSREIQIYHGDFNRAVHSLLADRPIKEREACFCLLDQRTFECHWTTLTALAEYKESGMKIELFYFMPAGWFDRAMSAIRNEDILKSWWGREDWGKLRGVEPYKRAELVSGRIKEELGYKYVTPWPIFERKSSGRVMYSMIHATDHDEAPNLMHRAYHKAVTKREPLEQFLFEFGKWKSLR